MNTSRVAHLALAGLLAVVAPPHLSALQPADPAGDAAPAFTQPRPRPQADQPQQRERARAPGPPAWRLADAETPKLGVYVDVTEDGILVDEIVPDSLAAQAGVQAGDLLLTLGGQRLDAIEQIRDVLADSAPGSNLEIGVVREGQGLVKLQVRLPEAAPPTPAAPPVQADGHKGGFLGVMLGPAGDGGVNVADVVDDSAAWFAGLESGDVLTAIDGESVASSEDVVGAIASREPGTMVDLAWQRGGEAHSARVRLGRRDVPPFGNSMLFAPMPGSEQGELGLLPPRDRPGNQAWPRSLRNRLRQVLPRFGQGQGPGAGPRWQDDRDQDLDQDLDFDDEDADFGASGPQGLRGWLQQLEDHLRDLHVDADLDLDDAHDVRITLEDGKLTIDKDGQSSTYDLPAPHEQPAPDGAVQQDAQRLAPLEHALQAALVNLLAPSTAAAAPGGCGGTCPLATSPAAGTATTAAAMKMQRQQAGAAEAPADCGGACPHSASAGAGTSCPMKAKDQVQAGAGTTAPAPLADQVPSGQDL